MRWTHQRSFAVWPYLSKQVADLLIVNFDERSADKKLLVLRDGDVVEDVYKGVRNDTWIRRKRPSPARVSRHRRGTEHSGSRVGAPRISGGSGIPIIVNDLPQPV